MKKSINKIRIKELAPIFVSRSEYCVFRERVNSDRDAIIEIYRSFFSDNKKKFDSLYDVSRQVQDRLDYQLHMIRSIRIVFSCLIVLLSISVILISFSL